MFLMERPYILEKKSVLFMKNVRTFCVKSIIRKTKCSCHSERSVLFRKTKRT